MTSSDLGYTSGYELILNAAEGALQIALTGNGELLCFEDWRKPREATEILAPALEGILARLGLKVGVIRRIACVRGPGSFTGIRLVLATAAALRRVSCAQLAGLDYLQALATSLAMRLNLLYGQKIFVLTHARRNLVHFQPFLSYGPVIPAQPLSAVELLAPEEALSRLALAGPCHFCGSALGRHEALFGAERTGKGPKGAPEALPLPAINHADAAALCLLARHGDYFPQDLEPLYVRPCDALENLPRLSASMGQDEGPARTRLEQLLSRSPESASQA